MTEEFALCWNNFTDNIVNGFSSLMVQGDSLCDVTLAVDGKLLKAHKIVLSLSSPYFKAMFSGNPCQHPIVFLKDTNAKLVQNLLEFIYLGKTHVKQTELKSFMNIAESLQVKGLSSSQKEAKEALESCAESNSSGMKRSHSQTELQEHSQSKEPKLEDIDLTEDDNENSISDADIIPEVSMIECQSEESKVPESSLKITSIVSANHFDFNNEKYPKMTDYHQQPIHQTCPNTDIVMYSPTSLLFENCIFNKNNVVATQQGLKTYWLCKSYRVCMCKARCISHQGKVISATGTHNHPPHVVQKQEHHFNYNQMSNPSNEFFNQSTAATSNQTQQITPYQPFLQSPNFPSSQHPRSPNVQNISPSGNFKMENI